jgi:hypothetical protein
MRWSDEPLVHAINTLPVTPRSLEARFHAYGLSEPRLDEPGDVAAFLLLLEEKGIAFKVLEITNGQHYSLRERVYDHLFAKEDFLSSEFQDTGLAHAAKRLSGEAFQVRVNLKHLADGHWERFKYELLPQLQESHFTLMDGQLSYGAEGRGWPCLRFTPISFAQPPAASVKKHLFLYESAERPFVDPVERERVYGWMDQLKSA